MRILYSANDGNDLELYLWEDGAVVQISNDEVSNLEASLSDRDVVWTANDGNDFEIFFWDGETEQITQLSDNNYHDYFSDIDQGRVVWHGDMIPDAVGPTNQSEIFLWDGTETTMLTENRAFDGFPHISGEHVAWINGNNIDSEVFLWDGQDIIQITDDDRSDANLHIADGNLSWSSSENGKMRVMFWGGESIEEVIRYNNGYNPTLSPDTSNGYVLWSRYRSGQRETLATMVNVWDGEDVNVWVEVTGFSSPPQAIDGGFLLSQNDGALLVVYLWDGRSIELPAIDGQIFDVEISDTETCAN